MLNYTFSRWTSVDPLAEKFYNISPFALSGNNPRYIDLNGMEFTDAAWEWVYKLVADIDRRLEENQESIRGKQAELRAGGLSRFRTNKLNRQISRLENENSQFGIVTGEIATLAVSNQMYNVRIDNSRNTNNKLVAATDFNFRNGDFEIIMPSRGGLGLFAHEMKHAYQFETGAYSIGPEIRNRSYSIYPNLLYDQSDEVAAFARGSLFGGDYRSASSIASDPHYGQYPKGPIDYRSIPHINNNLSNSTYLRGFARMTGHAFRINGVTYYHQR
jgi:hypothetical protein